MNTPGLTNSFDFPDDSPAAAPLRRALRELGVATDDPQGRRLEMTEEAMASAMEKNGWLTVEEAKLWTHKHLYYEKLGIPCFVIKDPADFIGLPWARFWLKPSCRHTWGKLNDRVLVDREVAGQLRLNPDDTWVAMADIPSDEQVWVMTLWDSRGGSRILWYSTLKRHSTRHPLADVLAYAVRDVGAKLGLKRWMAFMEFCTKGGSASFLDLNPRLPGDDDWPELVWQHLSGRSLGMDIANLLCKDRLPPEIQSEACVEEAEWDGSQVKENQRVYDYSDGYKERPVLTFR